MSETIKFSDKGEVILLVLNNSNNKNNDRRVFLPSENINIFPCSRRGQVDTEGSNLNYDPEARLNTERTNRLRTAINGFTDSFIDSFNINKDEAGNELETYNLVFVLRGYRVEIKNFKLSDIIDGLDISEGTIYAHLSLHDNIPLGVADYFTEILYRQSTANNNINYLDVSYSSEDITGESKTAEFFMGVSFTKNSTAEDDTFGDFIGEKRLESVDLALFSKSDNGWELVQTSLLPKIEHGETENSINISGDFVVKHSGQPSFKVTKDETCLGSTVTSSLTVASLAEGLITLENGKIDAPQLSISNANITGELKVQNDEGAAKIITDTVEATTATIPVITGDTELTGKIAVSNDLDVAGVISTPTLKVDTISSESGDALTVDSNVTLNGTMAVSGKITLDDELIVNNKKATFNKGTSVAEGLTVSSGDTSLKKTQVEGLTDTGTTSLTDLSVSGLASITGSLNAGSIQTTGGLIVTGESNLTNVKTEKVITEALELKDIGQVPALELAHLTETDTYQLRFKFGPIATTEE